jgi:hypothetical protein
MLLKAVTFDNQIFKDNFKPYINDIITHTIYVLIKVLNSKPETENISVITLGNLL